ncbi:MAG: MFS transporter [Bacteroidales bacterium]
MILKSKPNTKFSNNPWSWVPTLYFAEALPYVAVNVISVIMFKNLGMSNTNLAFYTAWLYFPWVIKPFWSPFVDILKTKRWWAVAMQFLIAILLAAIAFTLPLKFYTSITLAVFWLIGFASATHDIAADGFYMLALDSQKQSLFVGIRSTFYRLATIFAQGVLIYIAGRLETSLENIPLAWEISFIIMAVLYLLFAIYHYYILPKPAEDKAVINNEKLSVAKVFKEFLDTFKTFFQKDHIWIAILFILLFRLPEAQVVKMLGPFMLDSISDGGLGLHTSQVGMVYGTIGVIGLVIGGIIGGILVSKHGLKKCLWPMALSITIPCFVYCYLSMQQPDMTIASNMVILNLLIFIEQFGYGFGFTAFLLYMMYFVEGSHKTSHYALCTAFMALGMMLPGMAAGWIQSKLGYVGFFWWIMACSVVTLIVTALIKIDSEYGKKQEYSK